MPLGHARPAAPLPAARTDDGDADVDGPGTSASPRDQPLITKDRLILAYVLGLLVLWSPSLYAGLFTPRAALLAVAVGPGLVVIGGLVRRRDGAARWAAGYLAWAALAAVASGAPRIALVGTYGSELGWVYLAGYVGSWGLGRALGPDGRRLLPRVLVVGLAANAAFAVLEAALSPDGMLASDAGRVLGLTGNCLYLGGLAAGGMALGAVVATSASRWWAFGVAAVATFTLTANLTGSRGALVGGGFLAVLVVVLAWRRREGQGGAAAPAGAVAGRAALVVLALGLGLAASIPLQHGSSGTGRIDGAPSSGMTSRAEMWRVGLDAVADRPVVGWGPGRFRAATSSRTTAAFVRAEGPEKLFFDAHDLFVENLVAVGVPGLLLAIGFGWSAGRRARGPLAWFAAGVAVTWLLSPVSISTGPVAMLALGAAWRPRPDDGPHPVLPPVRLAGLRLGVAIAAVAVVLGTGVAVDLVVGDVILDHATKTGNVDAVRTVVRLHPPDAVLADLESSARALEADSSPTRANKAAALRAARRAPALDPTRSTWWVNLGYAEGRYGPGSEADRVDRAEAAFREALRRSPWSTFALDGLVKVAQERKDHAAEARWRARLCEVDACGDDG